MKIAVYYDLPPGGALVHTQAFISQLQKDHQVKLFIPNPPVVKFRLFRDLQALFWSRNYAKKIATQINTSFDVAYVTHDRFFQAPWILKYLKIPSLHYSHNPTRAFFEAELGINPSWPLPNRLYEWGIRLIKKHLEISFARCATLTATSSSYMVDYLARAYKIRAELSYPGVNTEIFSPLGLKKRSQIVLVGNDESQKALLLALYSLAQVPEELRPTLVIASPRHKVGDDFTKLAASLGVNLITYVNLTPLQLNKLYNRSLLTMSVALREPFGLSIVESLAAGTPVVAVNEGGFSETVRDKIDGVLVNRDVDSISEGITYALTHLNTFRPKCRFSLSNSNRRLITLLSQLPKYPH